MFEHQIKVLTSLSDNRELFRKELKKSFKWLNSREQSQLIQWLKETYNSEYNIHVD